MAKKRGSKKQKVPQKGDPDYLTPTQLRNRRKRRAKQQHRQQQEHTPSQTNDQTAIANGGSATNAGKPKRPTDAKDPSMKYIAHPAKAPIVQAAEKYFQQLPQNDNKETEFRVHVGPLDGWRTVSKLAVRPDREGRVAIGLFLPQTHTLLSVPKCRAHHPSINEAVAAVARACHEVGVIPYQETGESDVASSKEKPATGGSNDMAETGSGQLRYVAVNVARATGAVQLTLVWNTPPPDEIGEKQEERGSERKHVDAIDDSVLKRLVKRIIAMSNAAVRESQAQTGETTKPLDSDADSPKSSGEPALKKRRRRGRREGKSTKDGSIDCEQADSDNGNNNTNATNGDAAQPATNKSKGDNQQPKINLHSLWINYNPSWKHSNAIFAFDATCWKRVHGPPAITEHLSLGNAHKPPVFAIPLQFPPNVFRQANIDAFTNIVGKIRQRMLSMREEIGDVSCVELYGGVGTIGLHVSDAVASLVSSDENPNNYACFMESVRALPEEIRPRLSYLQKNASDMVATETSLFQKCQALILDPPRKGLDDEVVEYLCSTRSKALRLVVYVSCGFHAFQRDCDALLQSGRWRVEFAEGHLLFPGSDAIETLAFFVPK